VKFGNNLLLTEMADGILSVLRNTTLLAGDSDEEIMKEVV